MKEMYMRKGVTYWRETPEAGTRRDLLLRESLGEVLRERRKEMGIHLRQMGTVSMGHVSEVERGKKEASSEVLQSMCMSLDISLSDILRRTADRMEAANTKELVDA